VQRAGLVILAVSRFRVANGLQAAVAAAFANRPGLVDAWPGFLGLETFTDATDDAVFYLVTRWSDRGAFHAWHHSPAHRQSHTGMPKGLRLDPSYTQLVELNRIASPDGADLATVAVDGQATVGAYLAQTRAVHVVRCGLDGRVQILNAAMATRLGLTEAPRGALVYDFLTEPDAAVVQAIVSQGPAGHAPSSRSVQLNFCEVNGEPFTLACVVATYPDGCLILGEPVHGDEERLQRQLIELNEELASLARDRQRSVIAEQRARQLAEADNRDKDEGLAVIAHELRQPLSTAMAALGVLKLNPARAERALQTLDRQIGYMATLVEDLLRASQVMRGAVSLECESVDVGHLVRQALEVVESGVRERTQQVTIRDPHTPLMVHVDISRMRQVLVNILSNAVKYTPAGGVIIVSIERSGDVACGIRVRDTGDGMAAAALARVFDLFVRGTSGGNGLGIGLAVAKRLVELHGGTIGATSEGVGRGSEFLVTLPLVAHPLEDTRVPAHAVSDIDEGTVVLETR
jgi:signal transduction histidine kinase/heme-degrading monooxygenase HmoA